MTDAKRGRDRRRFPRVALDATVKVRVLSTDVLFETRIRDLSENGVFIITTDTRPIGTGLDLDIDVVAGGVRLQVRGIIVHEVTEAEATDARPCGIGVMFMDVEPQTLSVLERLIALGKPL